ncbi:MAG: peptidylprolyl isomerase [Ignavibacteria bacterium]|nr:peptidylprolyl isomerase [Ignavibacteria bacterium]
MNSIKIKIIFLSIFLLAASTIIFAQKEGDRILAVVGNDVILESDLQYQMQLYARQNQLTSVSPVIVQQIFQQLLTEKIILAKAEQDSIVVKDEEVNKELEFRIKSIVEQVGSEDRIQEIYGMPLVKIKLMLKDDLMKKLKSDKMRRKKFGTPVKVSDKETRDFYFAFKDSIPDAKEEFELSHILLTRNLTASEKQAARDKALLILDSVKSGVDFSELAKRNSDDKGSAVNGGDLGFAKRGVFVKEFEETLFTLNIGEVSNIVETEFGFHIIKLLEKKGEQYRGQHILVAFQKLEASDFETINTLNAIKDSILSGKYTFEDAAKKFSQDPETSTKGGYLGFVPVDKLDSLYMNALNNINIGEISKPVKTSVDKNYGYELLLLKSKTQPHKLTLENDFDRIRKFAQISKENKAFDGWIEELKKNIYVDVKF